MLNHVSFGCSDLALATAFYDAALAPLGFVKVCRGKTFTGYSRPGHSDDQFSVKHVQNVVPPGDGFHLAFSAPSRAAVIAFHKAALEFGGKDNGLPGLRLHYGPNYFAAFVTDLDGYAIEAVCHNAE